MSRWKQKYRHWLFERGMRALKRGNLRRVEHIGDRLWKMRYSGSFELLGRMLICQEENEHAADLLAQGVDRFPKLEILWSLLGEARSNSKDYDGAEFAFSRLLDSEHFGGSARVNLAIVSGRRGRPEEGLAFLDQVPKHSEAWPRAQESKMWLLNEMGKYQESLASYSDGLSIRAMAYAVKAHHALGAREEALRLEALAVARDPQGARQVFEELDLPTSE